MSQKVPLIVQHTWTARHGTPGVYDCHICKSWTANIPAYRFEVCPKRDRRKAKRERRHDNVVTNHVPHAESS